MRKIFLISAALICGCKQAPQETLTVQAPAQPTILDTVLAKADYSNAIVQAERNLPTDEWVDKPYRHNHSRDQREGAIAKGMFTEITAELKSMNITNLVKSFKVVSHPYGSLTNNFEGVALRVYATGNQLIINEIKTRPTNELQVLRSLGSSKVELVEGPQGFGLSLDLVMEEILDDLRDR